MNAYQTYPRRSAITRRFTLGLPRSFRSLITADGPAIFFLRAVSGDDPVHQLLRLNPLTGEETVIVDAYALNVDASQITAEERAQRERLREQASGVTAYDMNTDGTRIVFTLGGELFTTTTPFTTVTPRGVTGAFDPRIAPDGRHVAFHRDGGVTVMAYDTGLLASLFEGEDSVFYGRAEFIAAEEMGRTRGLWWLPDSTTVLATRVDESPVDIWHISDPARPTTASRPVAYPAAGSANALVSLHTANMQTGTKTTIALPAAHPYLARVSVSVDGVVIMSQSRDQRDVQYALLDATAEQAELIRSVKADPWVELIAGTPRWHDGQLVTVEDRPTTTGAIARQVCVDGVAVSPCELYVRDVVSVDATAIVVHASMHDATTIAPYIVLRDEAGSAHKVAFPTGVDDGIHAVIAPLTPDGWWVHSHTGMTEVQTVYMATASLTGALATCAITVTAEQPGFVPKVRLLTLGERQLNAALILPEGADATTKLPVLLDPYGGPHAQRVLRHAGMYLSSAWFAAQGFAVLIIDGQGTPGRDPMFEYALAHDLSLTLDDQIAGLHAAAAHEPRLDLDRVAIRGWSFGGYLAALGVLRRPDVFHAAVAGAPVTYWQWYDTHYTERYLGHPDEQPEAYRRSNLISENVSLNGAAPWDEANPPALMLIHGLADDNVVAAHTLALSSALLADNRPHQVLPLSGVTHMTAQEQVAEALLLQQARFLRAALHHR
ncbi:MAG: prolyl oligopeptidase family serine peptidase [Nitriliruptoraceae bacterium]